jgi:tetratricopeptide (TPR) repeat protein
MKPATAKRGPRDSASRTKPPLSATPGSRWPGAVALAAVFALAATLALRQVGSLDVGFHLAVGERLLQGAGWPRTDPFTYTVPDHRYVDPSWGYQLLLALVARAAGPAGLVLLHVGLVLAAFGAVAATARHRGAPVETLAGLLLLGVLASELRFEVRPELVSYALLALVLWILERRAAPEAGAVWPLPVIFLAWANLHSLFFLGWVAIGAFALGLALRDRRLDRPLLLAGAASAGVTLINPYGIATLAFPLTLATRLDQDNVFGQSIGEFVSPFALRVSDAFPFYPRTPIGAFRLLFLLVLVSLVVLAYRRRWPQVLVALPFVALAAAMVRNMPLLAVAALPGAASALGGPVRRKWRASLALAVTLVAIAVALRAGTGAYYHASRREERPGLDWNAASLPVEAAAWAARAKPPGRVLNHLNFGGWLIWSVGAPVFVDGRLEVIGEEFYESYRDTLASTEALETAVARWDIGWIVFPYKTSPQLLGRLARDPRWRLAWVDPLAVVFVRDGPQAARLVDARRLGEALGEGPGDVGLARLPGLGGPPRRGALGRWLAGSLAPRPFPTEPFSYGLFEMFRGAPQDAARRFAEAIRASGGDYYEMYANLGAALWRLGRYDEAAACYRVVLDEDPDNPVALERLREAARRP